MQSAPHPAPLLAAEAGGPDRIRAVPREPLPLAEGEVRLAIEACGICGSDLHFYRRGHWAPGAVPGHEMVARVAELGPGATRFRVGERVAVEPLVTCGECAQCRAGLDSRCPGMGLYGIHRPGGLASELCVPERRLYPVSDTLDPAVAALTEPVAVAVHALERVGYRSGERVLVLGAGTVGLVSIVAARAAGAREIAITARHPHQRALAKSLGATQVIRADGDEAANLDALGRERPFEVVVETVGGEADTLEMGARAAAPGARIAVLGLFFESPKISPFHMLTKELTLAWSNCYDRSRQTADFAAATRIVESEAAGLGELITHRYPLSEVAEAFRAADDKSAGAIKVSVLPGSDDRGDQESR